LLAEEEMSFLVFVTVTIQSHSFKPEFAVLRFGVISRRFIIGENVMNAGNMPKKSNMTWYIAAVVIVIVIVVVGVVAYEATLAPSTSPTPSPSASVTPSPSGSTSTIDIYAGEVSSSTYGFGTAASSITSPGPTLTLKAGQTVTVNFHNAGTMAHNWAIVDSKSSSANVLWSAHVGSGSNPISQGGTASVTFTVGSAGSYFYICQVDAHVTLGMWGTVTVNP
jgi:plastocyanin